MKWSVNEDHQVTDWTSVLHAFTPRVSHCYSRMPQSLLVLWNSASTREKRETAKQRVCVVPRNCRVLKLKVLKTQPRCTKQSCPLVKGWGVGKKQLTTSNWNPTVTAVAMLFQRRMTMLEKREIERAEEWKDEVWHPTTYSCHTRLNITTNLILLFCNWLLSSLCFSSIRHQ